MSHNSYSVQELIEKLESLDWAGTTYELPVWLYEAILEHLKSATPPATNGASNG